MGKKCFDIYGGAIVARRLNRFKMRSVLGWIVLSLLLQTSVVFAQGSIFGTVSNSNLTTPANGEVSFYGFTDNTDDEIRLESSVGAGYDAGNWFDDFQNYLSKTPGNPYMYRFFNTVNGEGAVLAKAIPSNSFQQENITLGAVTWPAAPTGMAGRVISSTSVVLTWTRVAGQTYHVYRRPSSSSGSFFRIDNPAGLLTAAGVADSFFVDNTISGGGSYDYLLIAQDAGANLGPHSAIVTVATSAAAAPTVTSVSPSSGSAFGGTAVVIAGSGFDINGATVTIGGAAMTSVSVVSPFQINGVTPSGTSGAANVVVLNTSAALSGTLTGGYTYLGNVAPVLATIGPRTVAEGANLNFAVSASDPDGTTPALTTSVLPANATFLDNGNGTGTFNFSPNFTQAGTVNVTFYASDGTAIDSEQVVITVTGTNQTPVLATIGARSVAEGANLNFAVTATDGDGTTPTLTTSALPPNATFLDNGNGTGTFNFNPDFTQAGTVNVTFYASDGTAIDSEQVVITVTGTNQVPVLATIGARSVAEGANLNFSVTASDADGTTPALTTSALPTNATFLDNGNGTGTFNFNPDFTQAGTVNVTFFASDGTAIDSEQVVITVTGTNQAPVLATIGARSVAEGANLNFGVSASDPDATTPVLTTSALPANATFLDNGNGTGTFDFNPDFTQAGTVNVTFYTSDGSATDSEQVVITVTGTNQAPVLATIGARSVVEGAALNFSVTAADGDGAIPVLTTSALPNNATFVDNGNGTGTFGFNPTFVQAGVYSVTFRASDGLATDSEIVAITVTEAGNQAPVLAAIGPQVVTENTTLNFTVSATDVDATIPSLTTSVLPANASFVDNGDGTGTFTFTPDFTQAGPHVVTFTASDGTATDFEDVTITVNDAGNQIPVLAAIGAQAVNEGAVLSFPVTATDADGVTPILSAVSLPTNATFVDNGDGTGLFTFSPDFTQASAYVVTFRATDGAAAGVFDFEDVTITVTDINQVPVLAAIGPQTVTEAQVLALSVSAADADGPIPVLTTSPLPANATFTDNGNGTADFNFSPNFAQAGAYTVTFYATDQAVPAAVDSEQVTITVSDAGNQAPVLASIGPKSIGEGANLAFAISATDLDGTIPVLTAVDAPSGATFTDNLNGTGNFSFTPGFAQAGSYNVTFIASDGVLADSEVVVITVTDAGNVAPTITAIPDTTINEGGTLVLNVTATDPDGTIPPALSVSTTLLHFTFVDNHDGTGVLTYSPNYFDAGVDTVRFYATDYGTPQQTGQELAVITTADVNRPPTWTPAGPYTVLVGDTLTFTVQAADSTDPTANPRVFLSLTNPPVNSQFTDNQNNTGTFQFVPTVAQLGPDTLLFLGVDAGIPPLSTILQVIVSVQTENSTPVLNPIGPKVVTEGQVLTFQITGSDPDAQPVLFSADNLPTGATLTAAGTDTATFTWTPPFTFVPLGQPSRLWYVTFKATDGLAIDKEVVLIQIKDGGNQQPVFDSLAIVSVVEGLTATGRMRASDPDGGAITMSVIAATLPANATFADSGQGLATITFNPSYVQAGLYQISVIASDGVRSDTGVAEFTVVEAGNQPPVLDPINDQTATEMTALAFRVHATDIDGTPPNFLTSLPLPGSATFVDSGNGAGGFVWVPTNFDSGTYEITFFAVDDADAAVYDSQIVSIHIVDSNLAPIIITTGGRTIFEGDTLRYTVFSSDADLTMPILRAVLDAQDTLATNMVFVDSGNGVGVLTFTPNYLQGSVSGIFYNVRFYARDAVDPALETRATAPVQITVRNRNAPPELTFLPDAGPFTIPEGANLSIDVGASDVDGTTATITVGALPLNASYNPIIPNYGTFTFAPSFSQSGVYSVLFTATDPSGAIDTQRVVITVTELGNQLPTFTTVLGDTINCSVSSLTQIHVHATDPEAGLITLSAAPIVAGASFFDSTNGGGVYSYLPDIATVGQIDQVQFIAIDPAGGADTLVTHLRVVAFLRGDLDANRKYTVNDLALLAAYLFRSQSLTEVVEAADTNGDGFVNISDIAYMVSFLYYAGPRPPQ